jgi:WD40 repeat protein
MNKILQGVSHEEISSDIREIQNTQNSEAGEKETSLKPIYLRNPVVGNIRCPSEVKHKIIAHNAETTCIEFNNDGEICYTGGGDGLVRGWRVSDGKKVAEMQGFKQAITGISASLEGDYVVASSIDGHRMQLFRVKTNAKLMQYTGHVDTITSCKFNYSQKSIFSSSNDRTVREWDIDTAK